MKTHISALTAALAVVSLLSCGHKEKATTQEESPSVDVAEAFTDSVVLHKTYPGYLSAESQATVVAQVSGRLLSRSFQPGAYVRKGQTLFSIDPTLYRDEVSRAEAALTSAISARDYAASHYAAVKKALEADAISKMEALNAESALQQAESDIKTCRAALSTARTNLGYCTVTAPISGYISDSEVKPGNYVNGAAQPVSLATIYDNSTLSAIFEIEDSQYEEMTGEISGKEAPLYRSIPLHFRDSLPHAYTADLIYEAPSVNRQTGTVVLKGRVGNIDNELKDGMYVTVSLPYGENPRAVLIEDAAIGTDQRGSYVYVVNDSNRVVYTPIVTGEVFRDSLRVVDSGVKPGDRYVTKALLTVRDGETVTPVLKK